MDMNRKWVCIVIDAYSTGALLASAFLSYGYQSVHVRTIKHLSDTQRSGYRSGDFLQEFIYDENDEQLLALITSRFPHIKCIVPGIESAVILADRLSERLGVITNGTAASIARRDKREMANVVERAGIPVISGIATADVNVALRWRMEAEAKVVIIKPKSSSGTFGFKICETEDALRESFAGLLHSRDVFDDIVDEILVQPLVKGQEYAVNFVSCDGIHYPTDVWRTKKRRVGQSKVYLREDLVYSEDDMFDALCRYVVRVLDALEIRWGPSHTEVIVKEDGSIVLIEAAARLMGALDISLVTEVLGHNAVQLTAEAYLAAGNFKQRCNLPLPVRKGEACMVQMLATRAGKLECYDLAPLRELRSYHGADTTLDNGDTLSVTTDSYTSPGLVFLSGSSTPIIDADFRAVRRLERDGRLYCLQADGSS